MNLNQKGEDTWIGQEQGGRMRTKQETIIFYKEEKREEDTEQVSCINRFTSLCKNLFNLLEFLAEALGAMYIIFNA